MNPLLPHAIILVESSDANHPDGNDHAIGDTKLIHHAYGCMQIRQPVCDDVNRVYGGHLIAQQMLDDRELSIATFEKYMGIYATEKHLGHVPTDEDRARMWNGGPYGYLHANTVGYWMKVESQLVKLAAAIPQPGGA